MDCKVISLLLEHLKNTGDDKATSSDVTFMVSFEVFVALHPCVDCMLRELLQAAKTNFLVLWRLSRETLFFFWNDCVSVTH